MAKLHNLTIMVEQTGKRIPVEEVDDSITPTQLLNALAAKIALPANTKGVLIRKITFKQLLPDQSFRDAGIESDETLMADFEKTAG